MRHISNQRLSEYLVRLEEIPIPNDLQDIVIYTAIMGGYDQLLDPLIIEKGVSYICFTDSLNLRSTTWSIIYVEGQYRDPRRTAKIYKMYPHLLFPSTEISIWVDGACQIKGSVASFLECHFEKSCNFSCFAHYLRVTVSAEREACKRQGKDDVSIIEEQENAYLKEHFTDESPLVAGGVLIRRHMKPGVIEFNEAWHFEVDKYSVRDLLSFNYTAWRHQFVYKLLPLRLIDNGCFAWVPHKKFRFYNVHGVRILSLRSIIDSLYSKFIYKLKSK